MDVVLVSRFSYLFKRIKWYDHTIPEFCVHQYGQDVHLQG